MANLTVEELKVLISAETAGLQKAVSKVQSQLNGLDKTTTKITTKMGNAFSKLARSAGITLTIAGLIRLGKSAVEAASALEEVQNVVDVSFGEAAAEIDRFAKTCMDRFGLSEYSAKKMASQFMAMGNSMGIANANSKIMSVQLTGLAADLASFYNVSVETAENALEGIYTGQTRALRQFGLVIDEATMEEYALSQGITKAVRTMTAAEQATLRYNYVLQQTVNAQNDFARTSGTWANQIRLLRQQWNAFMTELGSVITAVLLPVVKWLNTILAYLTAIVRAFKAVFGFGSSSAEKASKSLGSMSVSAGGLSENLGSATAKAKELKKTIAGFDELEILNGPEEDSGSGSGSVAPIGVSGGYDVGEYFDPEDWETPDLTEFQKKMEELFTTWKDGWGKLTDALTKNTETMEKALDWKKILGLGALAGILESIGSQLVKHFKDWFKLTENIPGLNMFDRLTTGVKYALFVVKKHFTDFIGKLGALLAPVGKLLYNWLVKPLLVIGDAILHPIKTFETLKGIAVSALSTIKFWITNIGDLLMSYIQNPMSLLRDAWIGIKNLLGTVGNAFKNLWGVIAANPLVATVAVIALVVASIISTYNRVKEFREALDELWRNVLRPVVDYVIEQAQYVWNSILKPLWDNVKGMVGDLVELVTAIWNKVSEFIAWVSIYILPPIWMVAGEIIATVTRIFGNIGEIVNGIITVIRGIITFLTGVFTGD